MIKNIFISAMAAVLIVEHTPCFCICTASEKVGIFVGVFIPLIIFCIFLDFYAEKWRKYRARVQEVRRTVERLRKGGKRAA